MSERAKELVGKAAIVACLIPSMIAFTLIVCARSAQRAIRLRGRA